MCLYNLDLYTPTMTCFGSVSDFVYPRTFDRNFLRPNSPGWEVIRWNSEYTMWLRCDQILPMSMWSMCFHGFRMFQFKNPNGPISLRFGPISWALLQKPILRKCRLCRTSSITLKEDACSDAKLGWRLKSAKTCNTGETNQQERVQTCNRCCWWKKSS